MRPIAIAILPFVLLQARPSASEEPLSLTLSQALDRAIESNPDARRVREQVNEFKYQVKEARSEALPTLDFDSRYTHAQDPGLKNSPFFSRLLEGSDPLPPEALDSFAIDDYAWSFSLEQPLYTFGRVGGALRAARHELEGVQTDVRSVESRLARDVAFAYYDLLLAREKLAVLESEKRSRARQLAQVQTRLELEDATRLEELRAEVALANLAPRLVGAHNRIRLTRARLNETLGRSTAEPIEPSDALALPEPLPVLPSVAELLQRASAVRPEFRRFELNREVLQAAESVVGSDVLPEIVGNASFGVDTFAARNFTDLGFKNWSVGVSLRWTLFDGFKTSSTVGKLRSQRLQSELAESSFRMTLARELEQAYGTWTGAVEALQASHIAVTSAREAQRVSEESYEWGAVTFLDVLESERALREAELTRTEALHIGLSALADIKYLIGLRPDAPVADLRPSAGLPAPENP